MEEPEGRGPTGTVFPFVSETGMVTSENWAIGIVLLFREYCRVDVCMGSGCLWMGEMES